jgi:peroxiredoxin
MKKIIKGLMGAIILLPFITKAQEQKYVIEGDIKDINVPVAKAYVIYELGRGKILRDSAMIIKGRFSIKGTVPYPIKAVLYISPREAPQFFPARLDQKEIYLISGTTTVKSAGMVKDAALGGTAANKDFQKLNGLMAPFEKEENELHLLDINYELIPDKLAQAKKMRKDMDSRKKAVLLDFINGHFNSIVALDILKEAVDPSYELDRGKAIFAKFSTELRASHSGKIYEESFTSAIGVMAPEFSSSSIDGQKVSLSDYRGRYVLIDFWASWCLPCRAQNPALLKAYEKYKENKFSILGISLDYGKRGKEMWLKAINMDHLTWDQVSDLNGFDNEASNKYQITAVPTNFLIDPNGMIIGKNLHANELEARLQEIFAKSK